jgi:hypothetical protein
MMRWPMLTAFAAVLLSGCARSVEVGLANAPRLGGGADDGVHDAISNGGDSCGRYAERGPLRGRIPPCRAAAHPIAGAAPPAVTARGRVDGGLVVPWLQHFYVGWPCQAPPLAAATNSLACAP